MTLPRLPMLMGWADELSPSLKSLGQSLPRIINPDFDLQQMLKERSIQDPNFIQSIANLSDSERQAYLQSLGARRENTTSGLQSLAPGLDRLGKERTERVSSTTEQRRNALLKDPTSAAEMDATQFGTQTPTQREEQGLNILSKKAGIKSTEASTAATLLNTQINEANYKKWQADEAKVEAAWKMFPDLAGINMAQEMDKVLSGQGNPNLMNRIVSDKGAKEMWDTQLNYRMLQKQHDFQMSLKKATADEDRVVNLTSANQYATQMRMKYDLTQEDIKRLAESDIQLRTALMTGNITPQVKASPAYQQYLGLQNVLKSDNKALETALKFQTSMIKDFYTDGKISPETLRIIANNIEALDVNPNAVTPSDDLYRGASDRTVQKPQSRYNLDQMKADFTSGKLKGSDIGQLNEAERKYVAGSGDLASQMGADEYQQEVDRANEEAIQAKNNGYDDTEVAAALKKRLDSLKVKYKK